MATNIVEVQTINGAMDAVFLTTSTATVITNNNNISPEKLFKINSLVVANTNTTASVDITVELVRTVKAPTGTYKITSTMPIPAESTLVVLSKDMGIYLEPGDSLSCTASSSSQLHAFCSYEIIYHDPFI